MPKELKGIIGFPLTPTMDDGEKIDQGKLRDYVDFSVDAGLHGLCIVGSTGGKGSFSEDERKTVVEAASKQNNGRVALMVGVSALTTAEVIRLSKHAEDNGADAVLLVSMSYWPLMENEVYEQYARVAEAINIDICVYNNPWTSQFDIKPHLVAKLAQIDNIKYIKESSGDLTRFSANRLATKGKIKILDGWEPTTYQSLISGAEGYCSSLANYNPHEALLLWDLAYEKKDMVKSRQLADRLFPLLDFIGTKTHARVGYAAMELVGRPMGVPRRPMRPLNKEDYGELKRILDQLGWLEQGYTKTALKMRA
ncbi:dihydrodipicolinate synthase family protein [Bradyrhizobium ottawaense]|uniref:dihydrodipicolinate synthase family protein n=1 Tax=Bradyrhizobium ottawaense TaxID=931866 RepID=UPI0004285C67|nr:dihydrodipicolinate synthase family protein [Bradyrhizobium ottawaense]